MEDALRAAHPDLASQARPSQCFALRGWGPRLTLLSRSDGRVDARSAAGWAAAVLMDAGAASGQLRLRRLRFVPKHVHLVEACFAELAAAR
jgi:hypothetical protein